MLYWLILILVGISAALFIIWVAQSKHSRFNLPLTAPAGALLKRSRLPVINLKGYSFSALLRPLAFVTTPFYNWAYIKKLQRDAETLRVPVDINVLIVSKIILGLIAGALTLRFVSPAFTIIGLIVGFFAPDYFFFNKIKAKKEAIVRIFPETIDLLDMCISAGADFLSAIRWVIDKSNYNPFVEQLGVVLNEVKVGKPRTEALKDMAKRLQIAEVSTFVRTVILAERMGTSIEEAFKNLSEDTRNMRFQAGERYAIKASLKILFPLLFCILPTILIVVAGPIIIKFSQGDMLPGGMGF